MSISGLFNIGITAMQTTNQLLDITSHNIANANTPGYTRQDAIVQSIASGLITTTGATGSGVKIADIQRMYNTFVNNQLNTENSNLSYWNNYQTGIQLVEDIFNEASTTGISPAITRFFTDWQNIAQNPQDNAQRTTLIQDAGYLSSRLSTAAVSLQNERNQLLTDSQSLAAQVNTDTAQIADLNAKIAGNPGALDLIDQRDLLVQQLNQIVKVTSFQDASGSMSLLLGGTPLVQGTNAFNLSANSDTSNMMHFYVAVVPGAAQGANGNPDVTSLVTGGQLKADLDLRDTKIPAYINQLNAFAVDLADLTNYYQKQGYGLNGSSGGNFFQPLSLQAKYTSVDSVNGVFTSQTNTFSTNGGTLKIKLGDNDLSPATVTVAAGATLNDVVNAINTQAGSKVTAAVVNSGLASQFNINASTNTITTDKGSYNIPIAGNPYTGASLAAAITAQSATLGIIVTYDGTANKFTITSTGTGGATQVTSATTMGTILGLNFSSSQTIGSGLTGTAPAPPDYRISIKSSPDGNLGAVRISVSTADGNGSGLNLLTTGPMLAGSVPGGAAAALSLVNVTNPGSTVANAQYQIDYINSATYSALSATIKAQYQQEGTNGFYWRVMESTNGSTWAALNPNTTYNPSNSSTIDETKVNLTTDASGSFFTRTLEFQGIKVQIDGGLNQANTNGGTFAVQLDPNAARDIKTVITDPGQVAASADMFTVVSGGANSNNTMAFKLNGGTTYYATIPPGTYTNDPVSGATDDISTALKTAIQTAYQNATGGPLPNNDTLKIVFNPNAKQFKITMTSSGGADTIKLLSSSSDPASTAGSIFGFSSDATVSTTQSAVSDTPSSVLSSANKGIPGDNRNATAIAGLANGTSFAGTTPVDSYNSLVSNIGVEAASAKNSQQYESNMVDQLTQRRSEVSGVSMDQEAANLVLYQKSYQAAAQMITVANTLLTSLMQMVSGNG